MTFDDLPVVPATRVCPEAKVSRTRGKTVLERLRLEGHITTPPTPTGRDLLTPREGRIFFEALTQE